MKESLEVAELQTKDVSFSEERNAEIRTFFFGDLEFRRKSDNKVTYVVSNMILKLAPNKPYTNVFIAFVSKPVGFYARVTSYTLIWEFELISMFNGVEVILKTVTFNNFRLECASRSFDLNQDVAGFMYNEIDKVRLKSVTWYFDPCRNI